MKRKAKSQTTLINLQSQIRFNEIKRKNNNRRFWR